MLTLYKYFGCALFQGECYREACGIEKSGSFSIAFRENILVRIWRHCADRDVFNDTQPKNRRFAFLRTIFDMRPLRRGGKSFLKLNGNGRLGRLSKITRYLFPWVTGEPSLYIRDQLTTLLQQPAAEWNDKNVVPFLYTWIGNGTGTRRQRWKSPVRVQHPTSDATWDRECVSRSRQPGTYRLELLSGLGRASPRAAYWKTAPSR